MTVTNPDRDGVAVQLVDWSTHAPALTAVRAAVFVVEQGVPPELEIDGLDPDCVHAAAIAQGRVVGTGRLLPEARVGRMAVLEAWRGRGVGGRMLDALVWAARARGDGEVHLAAQVDAIDFYRRHGFEGSGEDFLEAGIVHRHMVRRLALPGR